MLCYKGNIWHLELSQCVALPFWCGGLGCAYLTAWAESGFVKKPAHDARTPSVSTNQRALTDRNLVMTRVTTDDWSAEKSTDGLLLHFVLLRCLKACLKERERERERTAAARNVLLPNEKIACIYFNALST